MEPIGALQEVGVLREHGQAVWHVAWSPNGQVLASCGADRSVCLWAREGERWSLKAKLVDGHDRTVRRVAWSPDGRLLLAASFDATTSVWENRGGTFGPLAVLEGHEHEVKAAAFDSSGTWIATCSRDKTVWIWEMDGAEFECASVLHGHAQDVKAVLWHPTEALLASCSYDDTIKLWEEGEDDWFCRETLSGHDSTVWDIAFDPSGNRLASVSDDTTLRLWQRDGGGGPWRAGPVVRGVHQRCVFSVDWARCGQDRLATAGADNVVRVFGMSATGVPELQCASADLGCDVNCARWNPKEPGVLATCGDDKVIRIWRC